MNFVLMVLGFVLMFNVVSCSAQKPEESLKKDFPDIKYDSIRESPIKGLYEVVIGTNILYYYPEKGFIVAGSIFSKDKKNLTQERHQELIALRVKDIPLDKAIKIGSGKNVVIEFTDVDCPFCRKMSEYLKTKTDITRYVFLFPLVQIHPKAEAKSRYVLCSSDKAKALEDAMSGKFDKDGSFKPCDDPAVAKTLNEHMEIGRKVGVEGTPAFFVNGQFVSGANIQAFESFLKK